MSDDQDYRGTAPISCGFYEAEIRARAASTSAQLWKVHCLNGSEHKHDDRNSSAFYYPESGWYGCNVCGLQGFAIDRQGLQPDSVLNGLSGTKEDSRHRPFRPERIPKHAKLTSTHDYKRIDGSTIHRTSRYDWIEVGKDGTRREEKGYIPEHLATDRWVVGRGPETWEPYNVFAAEQAKVVYIVEGEKCADVFSRIVPKNVAVLTSAFGSAAARSTDWSAVRELVSANAFEIVFIPDRDASGETYIHSVAVLLNLKKMNVIRLGELSRSDGYDIADWLDEGNSWNDLPESVESLVDPIKTSKINGVRLRQTHANSKLQRFRETAYDREIGNLTVDERIERNHNVVPRRVRWLISQFVAEGQTTIIFGDSGGGKTTIVRSLIRHIVDGSDPFMVGDQNGCSQFERGRALWWLGEEDVALTKPNFSAAELNADDVDMLDKGHKWTCEDTVEIQSDRSKTIVSESPHTQLLNRIDRAASEGRPYRAIVIDPLSKMIGDTNKTDLFEKRWDETVVTLEYRGLAVIGIVHPRKDNPVGSKLESSLKGTERLFSLPRVVAYTQSATTKALLRQAKGNDNGTSHVNPIRDRFNATGNGEIPEEKGLIGVLAPLKNSYEQPELLKAWQYSILLKNEVGAAKFSTIPWRATDFDYLELDGRSFGAAVAGKYELVRRKKQTKQEKLASEQLEDRVAEADSLNDFMNALFDRQSEWTPSELNSAAKKQGYSTSSGAFFRARKRYAVFNASKQIWKSKNANSHRS